MKEKNGNLQAIKKTKSIHNKDVFQRVNFLHQASLLMAEKNSTLSCLYGNLFKQIQKKSVLKIDPSIKRDFCRRCSQSLTAATSEILSENDSLVTIKCNKCGYEKRYPINDRYKLWCDKDDALLETIEMNK